VASASEDGRVRLWNATSRAPIPFDAPPHVGPAYAVAFSPDGRRLASAGDDGTVRIYESESGDPRAFRPLRTFRDHRGFGTDVAFSQSGRLVVSTGVDGTIVVDDVDAGRVLATLIGHRGAVRRAEFSPDQRQVVSAGADGTARVWDWAGNAVLIPAYSGPARAVAISGDGRLAASLGVDAGAGGGGAAAVAKSWSWRSGSGQQAAATVPVPGEGAALNLAGVGFLDEESIAAAAGTSTVVGRLDTEAVTTLAPQGKALASSLAVSPDGTRIAVATVNGHLLLWRWPEGAPDGEIPASGPPAGAGRTRVAFFPDGASVLTGDSHGNLRVWSLAARAPTATAELKARFIIDVAVSPDGRLVAAATDEGIVRLRDARTLEEVRDLVGHTGPVAAVAFGALEGRQIVVTGGTDGTVRVWDAATGNALVTFRGQQGVVRDVAVVPGGRTVSSVADDGSLVFWPCDVCGAIAEVQKRAGTLVTRKLTPDEIARYVRD
jgi:WD40 repeat protein